MYCSVEEAWGNDFNQGNTISLSNPNATNENFTDYKVKKKKKKKISNDKINHENVEEINNYYLSENDKNSQNYMEENDIPESRQENSNEFIRGTNYIEGSKDNKYSFTRGLGRLPNHNGPVSREIASEHYIEDNYEEEQMIPENVVEKELPEEERRERKMDNNFQLEHNFSFLFDKINTLINKFENKEDNNNMNVILFILTGVFIIFILESVFKFGKYLNN